MNSYENNNCWWVKHPTINFFTFVTYPVEVFGHRCVVEEYQDGEIWSDEEYWGSVLYDLDNDRYCEVSGYEYGSEDWERIINNSVDAWDGKISEDFNEDDQQPAINYYKSYIKEKTEMDLEEYYLKVYGNKN